MPLLHNTEKTENQLAQQKHWFAIRRLVQNTFGKRPDLNAILFLIGINELGQPKDTFTKEEKQDLMHIAMCTLLETEGYYKRTTTDTDGWPHFEQAKELPPLKLREQESWLKTYIIQYFLAKGYIN